MADKTELSQKEQRIRSRIAMCGCTRDQAELVEDHQEEADKQTAIRQKARKEAAKNASTATA